MTNIHKHCHSTKGNIGVANGQPRDACLSMFLLYKLIMISQVASQSCLVGSCPANHTDTIPNYYDPVGVP